MTATGPRCAWFENAIVPMADARVSVRTHALQDALTIFAMPFGSYIANEEGAHVALSAWRRVDDNAIAARGKIAGAYVNSAMSSTDVRLAGYDEALVLNEDGHASEMSSPNVFIVRDGVAVTPPVTSNVLEGIVRRSVLQLLREELGVPVQEREIDRSEVYLAEECFMCGTGVQVCAITRVEHRAIGSGTMGEVTRRFCDLFFDVVAGKVARSLPGVAGTGLSDGVKEGAPGRPGRRAPAARLP